MVYFCDLLKRPVFDSEGKQLGLLDDLIFLDGEEFAEISHLIFKSEDGYRKKLHWKLVKELKEKRERNKLRIDIILDRKEEELNPLFENKEELLLGKILDKQVVDVNGIKVVRVNDILLGKVGEKFCVVAVCVGLKSMIRRLGMGRLAGALPKKSEHVIKWESIEPLDKSLHDIHIRTQKNKIADLHPEDIADIMEDLDSKERALIFKTLNEKKRIKTLIDAEPNVQQSFFRNLKLKNVTEILENIPASHAADLLSAMSMSKTDKILSVMEKDHSQKIREILDYPNESAAAIMHTSFIFVPRGYTAQQTIGALRKFKPESDKVFYIYVTNKQMRLYGVLPVRALVTAPPDEKVSHLMKKDVIKVHLTTDKDEIAKIMARYDLFSLPVVDRKNILKGVVTADEVLTEIMPKSWKKGRVTPSLLRSKDGRSHEAANNQP